MTRVLMVYHDADVADIEADELRHLGYEVDRCAGPVGGSPCPVLHGDACWQVEEADVLVYDTWAAERRGDADLADALRAIHPDIPLVLTSSRPSSADDATGRGVGYAPTRASLVAAIEEALGAPKVPPETVVHAHDAVRERHTYHGPRW
jgi:hypothetical protein